MITFNRFSQLPANEIVALWNKGFEGYFTNAAMNLDRFMARTVSEGLSLEHSLAMIVDGEPAGFVMNGFRTTNEGKTAWNGGTGIAPAHRGKGYGKQLMAQNVQLYREQNVNLALLEAIIQNEPAIKLYQGAGYQITGQLVCSILEDAIDPSLLLPSFPHRFVIRHAKPRDAGMLSFYNHDAAWQTGWQSLNDGECCIIADGEELVGYALYKRNYSEDGSLASIVLLQCEAAPRRTDSGKILKALLKEVFSPLEMPYKRMTLNIRDTHDELLELLDRLGFMPYIEQVHMSLRL
ncbi:GNAT family N-acetyltransferase [Paenibacillus lignilyticus]|uniref:GNAT family N-acetyltransferase n=1 Tax=Paenibacillus lignilyticus TaxID=1172615 RepID=A0ABS5CD45_9BACL|nr:GNAT family N-acetyltransferase [Paenibacillus lignilyticus]MBP3963884.1 GNAT family N-acetyltransferase [Paenibacillus lignilyticus]